jgi:hypothetical protein
MLFGFSFIWLQSPLMRHKLLKSAYGAIIQCLYVPKLLDRSHCWCIKPQILAFRRDKNLKDIIVHKKHNSLFFKQEHKCEPAVGTVLFVRMFPNFEGKTFNGTNSETDPVISEHTNIELLHHMRISTTYISSVRIEAK